MIPLLVGAAAAAAGIALASSSDDEKSPSQSESKSIKAVDESRIPAHIRAKMNMKYKTETSYDAIEDICFPKIRREIQSRENRGIEYQSGNLEIKYVNENAFSVFYELEFSNGNFSKGHTFNTNRIPPEVFDELREQESLTIDLSPESEESTQSGESVIERCMNEMHREIQSRENRGIECYGGTVKLRYMHEGKFKLSYELYFSDDDLSRSYTFDFDQLPPDAQNQLRTEKIISFDLNDNQDQSQDQSSDESESQVEKVSIDSLLDLRNFVDDLNFIFDLCKARDDTLKKYPNKQNLGGLIDIEKDPNQYTLVIFFEGEDPAYEVVKQGSIRLDSISGDARKILDRDGEVYIMFN